MNKPKPPTLNAEQLRAVVNQIDFDGAEMGLRGRFQQTAVRNGVRDHYNTFIETLRRPAQGAIVTQIALDNLTQSLYKQVGSAPVQLASVFGASINWQTIGGRRATASSISAFETKLRVVRAHSGRYPFDLAAVNANQSAEFAFVGPVRNRRVNANPSAETVAAVEEAYAAIRSELGQKLESQFKYFSLTERFTSLDGSGERVRDQAGLQREVLAGTAGRGDQGTGELLNLNRLGKKHDVDFQWIGREELLSAVREIQKSPNAADRLQALGLSATGGDEFGKELLAAAAAGGVAAIDAGAQPAPTVNPLVTAAVLKFHLSSAQGAFGDELQVQSQSVAAVAALGGVPQQAARLEAQRQPQASLAG